MLLEWENFNDFIKKYSIIADPGGVPVYLASEIAYYDGLGILLKQNMVNRDTMYELMGLRSIMLWFKIETIVKQMRKADGLMSSGSDFASNFEYLANEMIKMKKEKGIKLPVYWLHPSSTLLKKFNARV